MFKHDLSAEYKYNGVFYLPSNGLCVVFFASPFVRDEHTWDSSLVGVLLFIEVKNETPSAA